MTGQSTLGEILLDIQAGKSFQTAESPARPDELGVLKVSAVTWAEFRHDEAKALRGAYQPDDSHRVRAGDLLISRANTKEFVGAVVLVERDYPLRLLSDKTLRLVINENVANKEYLLFALRAPKARKHIEHFATGTSDSMRNISQGVIKSIPIDLPPLDEQCRIATRLKIQLEQVGTAWKAAKEQNQEAEALRASIYREAFRKAVPVAVPPDLGESPSQWHWHKLSDVARLESGHTPSRLRPDWWGGDVSWISLTEIRALDGQWVEGTQLRTNEAGIANSAARVLPRGTVCYSRTASVGFVAIMGRPMATSQDFANWVCGDALDPEFLMHALIRSRAELRELATGATHKTIYMPTLESFHVCAPEPNEQRLIVKALKKQLVEADTIRSTLIQQEATVSALPQRILAQAFEI
ncbi:restriction endonuclease subunit S [Bradyrhizobium sp. CB82]|uniref:restriction endonuclease subunit S n=1 Tax=Bradyrhizobium sp. CB82 TaxID=3039159 RepID=UPI0024B0F4D7|nr:restriction endonuclease subunit S [Bradyrhizobium sp. CB82]WFU40103.1 restriction endonuclease subunit S [Bradyrhizobium sp. CB82]